MDEWNWSNGIDAIWRGRYRILLVTALAAILTGAVVMAIPRSYEAAVVVRIGRVMGDPLEDAARLAARSDENRGVMVRPAGVSGDGAVFGSADQARPLTIRITARDADRGQAIRTAAETAAAIVAEHESRYRQLLERHTRYRDELARQIATLQLEVGRVEASPSGAREGRSSDASGPAVARAVKQRALIEYLREFHKTDVALASTEQTRVIGEAAVPPSGVRPRRAMTVLAGAASGMLLAIFWAVASDSRHRGDARQPGR